MKDLEYKYGNLLKDADIQTILRRANTPKESHHMAYKLAYKRYGEQYAKRMTAIFNHITKLYDMYNDIPRQPPCPTLNQVPTNTTNELKKTLARETLGAVGRGVKGFGMGAVSLVTRPFTKKNQNQQRSIRAARRSAERNQRMRPTI